MEKFDPYAVGVASGINDFIRPWLQVHSMEITVGVYHDVNQWHAIYTQNPLWRQLPQEICDMIAMELFYWETKYQCPRCEKIFDNPIVLNKLCMFHFLLYTLRSLARIQTLHEICAYFCTFDQF